MRVFVVVSALTLWATGCIAHAQDIPGIEICTAEKAMDRRTSCLQSNIDFLQKTMTKQSLAHQQKLDAADRPIEELKSAQAKLADELKKKADAPAAKDATPAKPSGK